MFHLSADFIFCGNLILAKFIRFFFKDQLFNDFSIQH